MIGGIEVVMLTVLVLIDLRVVASALLFTGAVFVLMVGLRAIGVIAAVPVVV